jgi:HK97 gp10 family phage protein
MADSAGINIGGVPELQHALRDLTDKLKKQVVRAALRDAARPAVKAAKALARQNSRTGLVAKSIRVFGSKRARQSAGEYGVFIRVARLKGAQIKAFKMKTGKSARANPNDPFYWRFLEFGTRKMRARPFLLPGWQRESGRAVEIFSARIKAHIEKANARKPTTT